jgi:phage terminase large subunit
MDLGFTNSPSTLSKVTTDGNNLFAECLIYQPTETPQELFELIRGLGLQEEYIWCDSAHPIFIGKLNDLGLKVLAVKKTPIMDGIAIVKGYKLHFVKNRNIQKEQENYAMREINGIVLDEPVKKHDHFMDALRYNVIVNFRR